MRGRPRCGEIAIDRSTNALAVLAEIKVVRQTALIDGDFANAFDVDVAGVASIALAGMFGFRHVKVSPCPRENFHKSFHKWTL